MIYKLPECVEVNGIEYEIATETEMILGIIHALNDPELDGQEKSFVMLNIFYPDFDKIPPEDYQEALDKCFWFVNGGESENKTGNNIKLLDWELDWPRIVSAVNSMIQDDFRKYEHFHWWTFLSYFNEIRSGMLRDIIGIRYKIAKHKKLDAGEKEFYRQNREIIDIKPAYTQDDMDFFALVAGKKSGE